MVIENEPSRVLREAARSALRGTRRDVRPVVQSRYDMPDQQTAINTIVEQVSSPEFASFKSSLPERLKGIQGQEIAIDIEGTLMTTVSSGDEPSIHVTNPYMVAIVEELIANGNNILIWTNARRAWAQQLRASMPDSLQQLPLLDREGWQDIVQAYRSHMQGVADVQTVLDTVRPFSPTATEQTVQQGILFFQNLQDVHWERIEEIEKYDPGEGIEQFAGWRKYPQVLFDAKRAMLIDDDEERVTTARSSGISPERIVKSPFFSTQTLTIRPQYLARQAEMVVDQLAAIRA